MCKQIAMRWLFCNKVNTVLLITVDLLVKKTGTRKKRETEILEKMKKRKREVKVQFLDIFYVMVIQIGCPCFRTCCGVWDGLDECEISRPEILSQSAPVADSDVIMIKNRYVMIKVEINVKCFIHFFFFFVNWIFKCESY